MAGNNVTLWETAGWTQFASLSNAGSSVVFSSDGRVLATVVGNDVTLWDVDGGRRLVILKHPDASVISGLAFSPDGGILAAGGTRTIVLWDVARRSVLSTIPGASGNQVQPIFSPNGRMLAWTAMESPYQHDIGAIARVHLHIFADP